MHEELKNKKSAPTLTSQEHFVAVSTAYFIGIVIPNILIFLLFPASSGLTIVVAIVGLLVGIPFLIIILAFVSFYQAKIEKNLKAWCFSALLSISIVWVIFEYNFLSGPKKQTFLEYIKKSQPNELTAIVMICVALGTLIYYFWIRKALKQKNNPHQ
jgi:amino acid transporter